jgi:hypothetical protein
VPLWAIEERLVRKRKKGNVKWVMGKENGKREMGKETKIVSLPISGIQG